MTSRLKRKLNDLGVDPASSRANESFCLIGTPLPPLEKSKDTGEFVPLWKQEVRDEKGRRRLHGAFTGGFSAGYFNSVGSKEGWAPSTFVSSRSDRAKQKAARPEDFMDDEDLSELQESRKLVDEHEEMDFGGTQAELRRRGADDESEKDSIALALESSLAPAPKDSIGAQILKKMGWRVGQGIGPRLTHAQKKAQDAGFLDSWKESADGEADEEAKKHMYPRRDTPVILVPRKDNSHGLGYVPGMRLNEGHEDGPGKGPNISAGFGLGALNDADDDDVDIYESAVGRQGRARMAYDESLGDDDHHISMGSRNLSRGQPRAPPAATTQAFSDGRPVLKGFVLSDRPVSEDRWFPLPTIPQGWTPSPRRVWDQQENKENFHKEHPPSQTHADWKRSLMSADERGAVLGETPLPSQPRSVFEFMSQKDRERLQNIRTSVPAPAAPAGPTPLPPPPPPPRGVLDIPPLHPSVAKAALQGFQPFTADPVKQSRYATFLNFRAGAPDPAGGLGMGPLPGQSVDEFNKELADYAKAATVFKPLSGAMAGRFRTAVVVENGPTVVGGLHRPDFSAAAEQAAAAQKDAEEEKREEDPRAGAVRLGMYGPLTRDVTPWQPAKLLCKRFGVKDPEVEAAPAPEAAAAAATMQQAGTSAEPGVGFVSAGAITDGAGGAARRNGPRDLANVGLGDDEDQGRDTLTYERPAMDVFKAIFASDDEDSGDESGADDGMERAGEDVSAAAVKAEPVPLHLVSSNVQPGPYTPAEGPSSTAVKAEKVDLASFKPTFVPRSERESRTDKPKEKGKREKDKKKKSAGKAVLSFDLEDGFGPDLGAPAKAKDRDKDKDKERKKRRKGRKAEDEDDDGMWVEKPPPEALLAPKLPPHARSPHGTPMEEVQTGPPRGRKRAIDFM